MHAQRPPPNAPREYGAFVFMHAQRPPAGAPHAPRQDFDRFAEAAARMREEAQRVANFAEAIDLMREQEHLADVLRSLPRQGPQPADERRPRPFGPRGRPFPPMPPRQDDADDSSEFFDAEQPPPDFVFE